MRRSVLVAAAVFLASCSSGHKGASSSTSTTSAAATTSTLAPTTTSTTVVVSTSSATTTTTIAATAGVRIVRFDGPTTAQQCNAPTMVQLSWLTAGAARVDLHIDGGPVFATYPNGAQSPLVYLACDGKSHTYTLVASSGGTRVSRSVTVHTTT